MATVTKGGRVLQTVNCFLKPGPVLNGYRRVGWQISWVGIFLVIISSYSLEDVYTVDIAILTLLYVH